MGIGEKNVGGPIVAIVQARMQSERLPGKVLMPWPTGECVLGAVLTQLEYCNNLDGLVVATTDQGADRQIVEYCESRKVLVYAGSENDVMQRYIDVVSQMPDLRGIVRITADCPLIVPFLIDCLIRSFRLRDVDYGSLAAGEGSATEKRQFPDGIDAEIFTPHALFRAASDKMASREHVTQAMWEHPDQYRQFKIFPPVDRSRVKMSIDTQEDYDRLYAATKMALQKTGETSWREIYDVLKKL